MPILLVRFGLAHSRRPARRGCRASSWSTRRTASETYSKWRITQKPLIAIAPSMKSSKGEEPEAFKSHISNKSLPLIPFGGNQYQCREIVQGGQKPCSPATWARNLRSIPSPPTERRGRQGPCLPSPRSDSFQDGRGLEGSYGTVWCTAGICKGGVKGSAGYGSVVGLTNLPHILVAEGEGKNSSSFSTCRKLAMWCPYLWCNIILERSGNTCHYL